MNTPNKELVNLTPHDLTVVTAADILHIPKFGDIARVILHEVEVAPIYVNGVRIPCWSVEVSDIIGLPEPIDEKIFIVSGLVRATLPKGSRPDVFAPGKLIRDADGNVIACGGLIQ